MNILKEHYIDTAVYEENMKDRTELQGTDEDEIFKGLNNYFRKLAAKQIRIAFEQAQEISYISKKKSLRRNSSLNIVRVLKELWVIRRS